MNRITMKMLEDQVYEINKLTGSPLIFFEQGHYHIDSASGGHKLVRLVNDRDGTTDITYGFVTKKELYVQLCVFVRGIKAAHEEKIP